MVAANHPPWNLSVLVVDDSRDGADSLIDLLTIYGYDARPAYTPCAALVTAPADVVILELRLPEMSGWELVRQMKERSAEKQPIFIAVTTCGLERDRQKSREAGIGLHLVKPVDPGVLNGVLKRFARALTPC